MASLSLTGHSMKLQAVEPRAVPPSATRILKSPGAHRSPPGSTSPRKTPAAAAPARAQPPAKPASSSSPASKTASPKPSPPKASGAPAASAVAAQVAQVGKDGSEAVPAPDVAGANVVTYSHYKDSFPTLNTIMAWSAIDDKYCISFVFKGDFKVTLVAPDGTRFPRDQAGNFVGLKEGVTYELQVDADPTIVVESKPLKLTREETLVSEGNSRAAQAITAQLKAMSADELRAQGEDYKQLLEQRELEDMLASH